MSTAESRKIKVGINGAGRIGRLSLRLLLESSLMEVVVVNEPFASPETIGYLLEFDSIHGKLPHSVSCDKDVIKIGDSIAQFHVTSHSTPSAVPWSEYGVELVLECSGKFNNKEKLEKEYFVVNSSVKRVLVSAPVKGALNVVVGCNDEQVTSAVKIVTAASCTTNCIGPVIKAIDAAFGIEHGSITTIHNITNTQPIMDAPNTKKNDFRRCRAGMLNLAPTSTGSAKAITMIFPHLTGKLNGLAVRVPLQNASITDLTLELKCHVTPTEVNDACRVLAENMPSIFGVEDRPLVSTDYVNDPRSSIVDSLSTTVVDGRHVKLMAWYDNEMGYSCRMVDLAKVMAAQLLRM